MTAPTARQSPPSIAQSAHALFRAGGHPTPAQQEAARRLIEARELQPAIDRANAMITRAFGQPKEAQ